MKMKSKSGLGVALLVLVAGCGTEAPSADNQALASEQNIADNGMIVDPEIPNRAVAANGTAAVEPEIDPARTNEPAAVKVAPVPPAAPKAPPKAKTDAPKAKADAPKAAPKTAPKAEPSPPTKAECLPEHRAAGHC
jgi:outer membrane biosynthesis protein TonB